MHINPATPLPVWDQNPINPKSLKIFKNVHADDIQKGCAELLSRIHQEETWPLSFKRALLDWCIWKHSTCEYVFSSRGNYPNKQETGEMHWGDKYAGRYYTAAAYAFLREAKNKSDLARNHLRFDHVYERNWLLKRILDRSCTRPQDFTTKMIGCVLLDDEHKKLGGRGQNESGWGRYQILDTTIVDVTHPEPALVVAQLMNAPFLPEDATRLENPLPAGGVRRGFREEPLPANNQNNAWVQVMLDTLEWERSPVGCKPEFLTEMVGTGQTHRESGTVFTKVRAQEKEVIRCFLATKEKPLILDFGCGVGRHSDFIRAERPNAEIWGVESEASLLSVCRKNHGERFVADLGEVKACEFDMALLLGNNAGIFGDEERTRKQFKRLRGLLRPGGFILGEFHPIGGGNHQSVRLRITYPDRGNPPVEFRWLFMGERWVTQILGQVGLGLAKMVNSGYGGARIFAAQKPR